MAKAKTASGTDRKRGRGSSVSDDQAPKSSASSMFLDQEEVMKAMRAQMAAASHKGKGRADRSEDESEDESESDDESETGEEKSAHVGGEQVTGESDAESSTQAVSPKPVPVSLPSRVTAASKPALSKPVKKGLVSAPKPSSETTFESLGLSAPIISALRSISIRKPTEIQSACVGPIMAGRDCIGGAKTGSGKTMAFALPILERIAKDPFGVFAVVLTPTRELAYQLTEQFLVLGRPLGLTTVTIVGGMDMMTQAQQLALRPHVVVATPGRLCDLLRSNEGGGGEGALSRVRVLVLDEADRMLTPTFAPELNYLFSVIPVKRQTCLFTATVSPAIMALAEKPPTNGRDKPFVYRVESETLTVKNLKQHYLFIPSHIRDPYLYYLLLHPPQTIDSALIAPPPKPVEESGRPSKKRKPARREPTPEPPAPVIPSTIIFTQRCATAHLVHLLLTELSIPSVPLHSHLSQPQRLLSLAQFRAGTVPVLVTTDVGSRGLDIPEVAMVINWDCPRRSDDYVHRVGRTARAGRGGVAVTVVTERDTELVQTIEKEINVKLSELKLPEEKVLEHLNPVSLAKRVASMAMHDSSFGERQATNKAKAIKRARRDAAM